MGVSSAVGTVDVTQRSGSTKIWCFTCIAALPNNYNNINLCLCLQDSRES